MATIGELLRLDLGNGIPTQLRSLYVIAKVLTYIFDRMEAEDEARNAAVKVQAEEEVRDAVMRVLEELAERGAMNPEGEK